MIMFTKFLTFFLHGPFTDYNQTCPVRPVPGANMGPRLAEPRRHQLPACPISKAEQLELDMGAARCGWGMCRPSSHALLDS
jgi:hypothetical protein